MKFNYEILEKMKDELQGVRSFEVNINEIIKQYKELMEKKKDFDNIREIESKINNLNKIIEIENQIETKKY